jgi:hypothetical protein
MVQKLHSIFTRGRICTLLHNLLHQSQLDTCEAWTQLSYLKCLGVCFAKPLAVLRTTQPLYLALASSFAARVWTRGFQSGLGQVIEKAMAKHSLYDFQRTPWLPLKCVWGRCLAEKCTVDPSKIGSTLGHVIIEDVYVLYCVHNAINQVNSSDLMCAETTPNHYFFIMLYGGRCDGWIVSLIVKSPDPLLSVMTKNER